MPGKVNPIIEKAILETVADGKVYDAFKEVAIKVPDAKNMTAQDFMATLLSLIESGKIEQVSGTKGETGMRNFKIKLKDMDKKAVEEHFFAEFVMPKETREENLNSGTDFDTFIRKNRSNGGGNNNWIEATLYKMEGNHKRVIRKVKNPFYEGNENSNRFNMRNIMKDISKGKLPFRAKKEIECPACGGTGWDVSNNEECVKCQGEGKLIEKKARLSKQAGMEQDRAINEMEDWAKKMQIDPDNRVYVQVDGPEFDTMVDVNYVANPNDRYFVWLGSQGTMDTRDEPGEPGVQVSPEFQSIGSPDKAVNELYIWWKDNKGKIEELNELADTVEYKGDFFEDLEKISKAIDVAGPKKELHNLYKFQDLDSKNIDKALALKQELPTLYKYQGSKFNRKQKMMLSAKLTDKSAGRFDGVESLHPVKTPGKDGVLFQIKTLPMDITSDGKPETVPGGEIYNVIGIGETYYITDQFYKPGVPQLIPKQFAEQIEKKAGLDEFAAWEDEVEKIVYDFSEETIKGGHVIQLQTDWDFEEFEGEGVTTKVAYGRIEGTPAFDGSISIGAFKDLEDKLKVLPYVTKAEVDPGNWKIEVEFTYKENNNG